MENEQLEYVLEDDDLLITESNQEVESVDQYGEVLYAKGSQTILLHNGEFYIQTNGETLLLGNDQESMDQLIINESIDTESSVPDEADDNQVIQYFEQDDASVVYEFPEGVRFVQNESLLTSNDDDDTSDADRLQPALKKIKLENQFVELDESQSLSFDVENHLRLLGNQENLTKYQYAVLKDGRLQFFETDSAEALENITENEDLSEDVSAESDSIIDLSKVTGRNLITGQTVTLDDYLERIHTKLTSAAAVEFDKTETDPKHVTNNSFLNRKFTIGKTPAGKKLVGKIVEIKTGAKLTEIETSQSVAPRDVKIKTESSNKNKLSDDDSDSASEFIQIDSTPRPRNVNVQELVFDSTGKILQVSNSRRLRFNEGVTAGHLNCLSRTLSGLAEMDSIRNKIVDKELHVKFVEKQFENRTQNFRKAVTHLKGYLEPKSSDEKNTFEFVLKKDLDLSDENEEIQSGKRFEDYTSLCVIITQDRTGHKSTRVNFYEKTDSPTACKHCDREFKSTGHLSRHLSTSHSDKTLTCHICHIKFGDIVFLNKHRRQHEHYFVCATCGKNFTTQSSLRRHLTVHDHSLRPLECTICSARFTDESSLCKHLIIHTGIRAYCCNLCDKTFATVGDLNFHRRIHDPVKMFYCEVCGREFSRHSNLLRHTLIHKGVGDLHKCTLCGCSYKFISSLTRHIVQNHMANKTQ